VWEWRPGDLLTDINEDEKEAIEQAERLDRRRLSKEDEDQDESGDVIEPNDEALDGQVNLSSRRNLLTKRGD
jgi:hypothetical protein